MTLLSCSQRAINAKVRVTLNGIPLKGYIPALRVETLSPGA